METIDLRERARAAVEGAWPEFEREHPRLARFLDRAVVAERAAEELVDDPAYRRGLADADAAAAALELAGAVKRWLARLVGG